jgi:hypothetical protein
MENKNSVIFRNRDYSYELPEICPVCNKSIAVNTTVEYDNDKDNLNCQLIFQCPNKRCNSYFIGYYNIRENYLKNYKYAPISFNTINFSKNIESISPNICVIYNEAEKAFSLELKNICGPGYRKAFEFLIKDYAKSVSSESDVQKIEDTPLSKVINNFIDHKKIKAIAEITVWIGNDETHYIRKWENHDINDLKNLINLSIHYIEMELVAENYQSQIKK